jgi:hypothetical protein
MQQKAKPNYQSTREIDFYQNSPIQKTVQSRQPMRDSFSPALSKMGRKELSSAQLLLDARQKQSTLVS